MAERKEPFGATTAAIVSGLFVLFIDKLLPLEHFFGEFPILPRILLAASDGLFVWKAWSYWEILDGVEEPQGSRERDDYDALVAELQAGGTPAKVYRDWLTKALDRVDIFFGDPGRNDKSWAARVLGLETPGARWTAPAFDRCLLLALFYPIVTIAGVWIWSGHVGVAEWVLGLWETPTGDPFGGLRRLAFGLSLAAAIYAAWRAVQAERLLPKLLFRVGALAAALAGAVAVAVAVAFAFALPLAVTGAVEGAFVVATFLAIICAITFAFALGGAGPFTVAGAVAGAVVGAALATVIIIAVASISVWSVETGRRGVFLLLFFVAATLAAFAGVWSLSSSHDWPIVGALLLIFGILTLVNAPFDWYAIGLTRALLRRGLAPGGRGPFFYAALDAIVAPFIIALLAFVTVFAVQTFDDVTVLRAGPSARILPLEDLFKGLETRPGAPEYWWAWLTLFSPLIPSALNLCVAAASLIRGLPFLDAWIERRITAAGSMRDSDRLLLAGVASGQIAGGVLATGLVLYFIGVWFLPTWLPLLGGYVERFSEALAAYDAPRAHHDVVRRRALTAFFKNGSRG